MADNYTRLDGLLNLIKLRSTKVDNVHTPHVKVDSIPFQHIDAFSRIRIANPAYRFDSQITYQIDSDLWDTATTGDGTVTHSATNRCSDLLAGATAGSNTAIQQSHYHAPYTPGRGQLVFISFAMPGTVPANGDRGVGYYDGSNGVYLRETATGLTLNVATTTDLGGSSVAQANWNIDRMDGGGPSGKVLDTTKTSIIVIQMQALYSGQVCIGFDIDGEIHPVHAFNHANTANEPYVATANLPIRYWASTSTDVSSCATKAICGTVISEGGDHLEDMQGRQFTADGSLDNAASGTLLVVRPKQQFNSINQNALIVPTFASAAVTDTGCWLELRRNATVTAGTFTDVDAALSTAEVSYAGNPGVDPVVTAGTGTLVERFWIQASNQASDKDGRGILGKILACYSHLLGTADNIALIYNGGSGTTDVKASLRWKELR